MPAYAFEGIVPVIDPTSYIHPTASIIGDVIIGPRCYIGPGASLRGDFGRIIVEGDSSIQDNCTLHASDASDCIIGRGATLGHGAIAHGCRIGENALIGMHSVILDDADIGEECLVGALSLVKGDTIVPARSLVSGNPATIVQTLLPTAITWRNNGEGAYQKLADRARKALQECTPLTQPESDRRRNTGGERPVRLRNQQDKET